MARRRKALAKRRSLGALSDNQRKGLLVLVGTAAAYIVYRWTVSRAKTTEEALGPAGVPGGASPDLAHTSFSTLEAQAFAEALPLEGQVYAPFFVQAGRRHGISPLLLAAVAERETGYGTAAVCKGAGTACIGSPNAKNPDYGLMQINRKNLGRFGGRDWSDPAVSIDVGAAILRDSIRYFQLPSEGTVSVGAARAAKLVVLPGEKPDPRPILNDRTAMWYGTAGYNAGPRAVLQAVAAGRSPDAVTTGNDYGEDTIRRAERIAGDMASILSGQGTA